MGLRRKTVVGHWSDPAVVERIGDLDARGVRLERGADAEGGPLRRQHAPGRGHRGRQGRGQLRLGVSVNGYGIGELVAAVEAASRRGGRRARGGVPGGRTRSCRSSAPGGEPARVPARGRPDRGGPPLVPRGRRLHGLHRHVRGPRRAAAAARDRGAAPDGRRLRLRRRGRLEDGRARPRREGDERRARRRHVVHGGLHVPPGAGRAEGARRPHARGLPVDRGREADLRDPSALDRREGRPRAARVHRRLQGRPSSSACSTSATGSASS